MIVRNSLNAARYRQSGEVNTSPSMTVPGQVMSLRELLDRFTRGLSVTGNRLPVFADDDDDDVSGMTSEEFARLDLAEQQEFIESRRQEVADIKRRYASRKSSSDKEGSGLDEVPGGSGKALAESSPASQDDTVEVVPGS